ncbi:MAG: HAD hydrolase-like protein, partial [Nanoarchaeota archaeon]
SKPWPDEIMKAEKLMRHKARFMVGDSIYDVMAGKKAGVKTIAILSGRYSRKQLEMVNADYILERFNDLLKIL